MAKLGDLSGGDPDRDVVYLWPENVPTWERWLEVRGQWRVGMSGPYAIDLVAVCAHLTEYGLQGDERRQIYDGIRACAHATLEVWAERRAEQLRQQQAR